MEPVSLKNSLLRNLTPEQKQQADAVAGGNFAKLLIELQIVRASFSPKQTDIDEKGGEFKRPRDIMNVFFSDELQARQPGSGPYFLEKKFPFLGPSIIKTMV